MDTFPSDRQNSPPELLRIRSGIIEANALYHSLSLRSAPLWILYTHSPYFLNVSARRCALRPERLYIQLDPEIQALLNDNFIDIEKALKEAGHDVQREYAGYPGSADNATKEPATILIATAAVILAATPVLREIIQNVSRRPIILKQQRLIPVQDSKGSVLVGSDGKPLLTWVEVANVVVSEASSPQKQAVSVEGPLGIRISYSSEVPTKGD